MGDRIFNDLNHIFLVFRDSHSDIRLIPRQGIGIRNTIPELAYCMNIHLELLGWRFERLPRAVVDKPERSRSDPYAFES